MVLFKKKYSDIFTERQSDDELSPKIGPDHQAEIPSIIMNLADSEDLYYNSLPSTICFPVSVSWSDADVESLVLVLFLFGKNFTLIKKFLENKGMAEILSFYYGKFYKTDAFRRWSKCRKLKGMKCMIGKKLSTKMRQHELLSRLIPHVSKESQDTLLKVSKSYMEGKTCLEEYISSMKSIVGLGVFAQAVGIGKENGVLTRFDLEPRKNSCGEFSQPACQALSSNTVHTVEVDADGKRYKGQKYTRRVNHSNDMSKSIKHRSTVLTVIDTNRLLERKLLKVKQKRYPPVELEDASMMITDLLSKSKGSSSTDDSLRVVEAKDLIYGRKKTDITDRCRSVSNSGVSSKKEAHENPDNDANKILESPKNQHTCVFDDSQHKRIIKDQLSWRVRLGDSNHAAVLTKRRRLTACTKAENSRIIENSSGGLGSDKVGFSQSSSFLDANRNVCYPVSHQQNGRWTTLSKDRSVEENNENSSHNDSFQHIGVACVEVEKSESFTFSIHQVPSNSENNKPMAMVEEGEQGLMSRDPCDVGSLEQPRRQSSRNSKLTVKALESYANEFWNMQKRQKKNDVETHADIFNPCRKARTRGKTRPRRHFLDNRNAVLVQEEKHLNVDGSILS